MNERETRLTRIKLNDELLRVVTVFNGAPDASRLRQTWDALRPLVEYYTTEWLQDFEDLGDDPDAQFGVLSEDGVWNEMVRFREYVVALRDECNGVLREYETLGD